MRFNLNGETMINKNQQNAESKKQIYLQRVNQLHAKIRNCCLQIKGPRLGTLLGGEQGKYSQFTH